MQAHAGGYMVVIGVWSSDDLGSVKKRVGMTHSIVRFQGNGMKEGRVRVSAHGKS